MFGLFGKKSKDETNDKVWISETAKWAACRQLAQTRPETVFVAWFEDTHVQISEVFSIAGLAAENLIMARQLTTQTAAASPVVFVEHYPLHTKEEALWQQCNLQAVTVFSALDEPLFKHFGSDKIIGLIKTLGYKEKDAIEHDMIGKAIKNAQQKIGERVTLEQPAASQAGWLMKNLVA